MGGKRLFFGILGLLGVVVVAASCARALDTIPQCASGQIACGTGCVDLNADSENCGACGTTCPATQACVKGACAYECPNGDTICAPDGGATGGVCVNTKTDNDNCGACGHACPAGQVCFGGSCSGTCGDAKSGQTVCGADAGVPYCANLQGDQANCGACGHACSAGQICESGTCQGACTSNQTLCGADGGAPYCADLMNDNANCGACGAPCSSALHNCIAGSCTNECTANQLTCTGDGGSYCVDKLSDNLNCGACGNVCPTNKPICANGTCANVGGGGTVRYTSGTIANVTYVKCGNGTYSSCNEPTAETSCTGIGLKLVSHASNGTSAVVSLGATSSCYFSISYFTNNDPNVAGQCLVGVSNAQWTSCCGTTEWHGNIVTVPTTLGQQFGYVYSADSGYNVNLSNVSGTHFGCQANATAIPSAGCSTYYVACL